MDYPDWVARLNQSPVVITCQWVTKHLTVKTYDHERVAGGIFFKAGCCNGAIRR